jgi:hypothetical protein
MSRALPRTQNCDSVTSARRIIRKYSFKVLSTASNGNKGSIRARETSWSTKLMSAYHHILMVRVGSVSICLLCTLQGSMEHVGSVAEDSHTCNKRCLPFPW